MTETFGMVATAGYSLAAALAVVAVIYYVTQHVHAVHDELTGRTAQREIAEMRAGRRGRTWLGAAGSAAGSLLAAARGKASGSEGSGSLHVRSVADATDDMERDAETGRVSEGKTGAVDRAERSASAKAEMGTTLLSDGASSDEAAEEGGTTLLSAPSDSEAKGDEGDTTEGSTTLLSSPVPKDAGKPAHDVETEGGTTLLSAPAAKTGDADEAEAEGGTTLLTKDGTGGAR
ncbi:hypothetical protein [uncultured Parolsenella sp.]|uniref:hypothetical protein n=1 Tax=uncultured Parolsenella sp. TaxID=2083008 RepID=UPI0027D9584A|nr:hypothetical protein [uncultured Parolsenella sp.]